jgi:Fur family ferric uptake transcriptional regulator
LETWIDSTLEHVRSMTGRRGGARRRVVQHLAAQDCCLSAQEIHESLRAAGDRVGIASVYRTLDTLVELALVQRVDLGDGVSRYERADPAGGHHHHHLVCDDCGKVEPFEDPALEDALSRIAGATGYALAAHDVTLRGACNDCR